MRSKQILGFTLLLAGLLLGGIGLWLLREEKPWAEQTNLGLSRQQLEITSNSSLQKKFTSLISIGPPKDWNQQVLTERQKAYQVMLSNFSQLQATNENGRRDLLPTLIMDSELTNLLSRLHQVEQQNFALTNQNPSTNSASAQLKFQIDWLNQRINDRVEGIMLALEAQLKNTKAKINRQADEIQKDKKEVNATDESKTR